MVSRKSYAKTYLTGWIEVQVSARCLLTLASAEILICGKNAEINRDSEKYLVVVLRSLLFSIFTLFLLPPRKSKLTRSVGISNLAKSNNEFHILCVNLPRKRV